MATDEETGSVAKLGGKSGAVAVCFVLGTGCLLPWNSILTLEDYFAFIFPHEHASRIFTLSFQLSALGTTAILAFCESKINTRLWNLAGYILYFTSCFLILVLDLGTSGEGGLGVFIGVSVTSGAFGVATAIAQGGVLGELSSMQPQFVQSFLGGVAASGVLTSSLRSITKAVLEESKQGLRRGAILFMSIASLFELVCVVLYGFTFPKLPIVKQYRSKLVARSDSAEENPKQMEKLSIKELFTQNKDYVLGMVLIYIVTLMIFPGFLSEDTGSHSLGTWYPVVAVAMFNVGDLAGRYIPLIKFTKLESRKGLMIVILSRCLLVPTFYFAAKHGGGQGWIITLTCFLGLTCGYLTVCVFSSAPKGYKGAEQKALGTMLVFCLRGGICAGLLFSWLWLIGKGW